MIRRQTHGNLVLLADTAPGRIHRVGHTVLIIRCNDPNRLRIAPWFGSEIFSTHRYTSVVLKYTIIFTNYKSLYTPETYAFNRLFLLLSESSNSLSHSSILSLVIELLLKVCAISVAVIIRIGCPSSTTS